MNKTRDTATAATLRANTKISGGGTITVDGSGNVLWSSRFIVISNGRGPYFSSNGYFDINCPTSGTITGVGGAANATATAAGIPLGAWQALYYIMPIGAGNASVAANFRVASYTANSDILHNWVLICHRNNDNGRFYFNNGIILSLNQSINTATYDSYNSELLDGENLVDNAATASTVVGRDSNGDIITRYYTSSTTNSSQSYTGQHTVNSPFYNTFSQTGSQYQAIVKGRCVGSGRTDIMSFGNLHNSDGTQSFAFHRIQSDGTGSTAYTLSGSSGGIWHSGNDGSGSGLDADLLDGLDSTSFIRSDGNDTATGSYLFQRNNPAISNGSYGSPNNHIELRTTDLSNPILGFHRSGSTAVALYHSGYGINALRIRGADGTDNPIWWGATDVWTTSIDGQARFFFGTNARSYYRSANGHEFRNSADTNIGVLNNDGQLTIPDVYRGRGFACRQGVNGASFGNTFNTWWTGSAALFYIDVTSWGWQSVPSDYRIKRNIRNLTETNIIDKIKLLRPVEYNPANFCIFKESDEEKVGFIAHEVQEVFPKAVDNEKDCGNSQIQSIKQEVLLTYVIKALQEQQEQIEQLKNEIELLKQSNS